MFFYRINTDAGIAESVYFRLHTALPSCQFKNALTVQFCRSSVTVLISSGLNSEVLLANTSVYGTDRY